VIDLLKRYGVKGFVTEDPGVWVNDVETAKKITAVGVHLRRNISSFGVGLNVTSEPLWFFRQIVACGLEGKEAISLEGMGVGGVSVEEVAGGFVECFVNRVNDDFACEGASGEKIEEVYSVREEDLGL
jgi:lipoyl(octanoyl) transferase